MPVKYDVSFIEIIRQKSIIGLAVGPSAAAAPLCYPSPHPLRFAGKAVAEGVDVCKSLIPTTTNIRMKHSATTPNQRIVSSAAITFPVVPGQP